MSAAVEGQGKTGFQLIHLRKNARDRAREGKRKETYDFYPSSLKHVQQLKERDVNPERGDRQLVLGQWRYSKHITIVNVIPMKYEDFIQNLDDVTFS